MAPGKILATGLVAAACLVGGAFLVSVPAFAQQSAIKALDLDNDGTLDLNEVTKAAETVFDHLQKDQDETLDRKEVGSRLSAKEFAEADPDKDSTLSKEEYMSRSWRSCSSRRTLTATASWRRRNCVRRLGARFCA